jgi:branched-chain amino acid transport system substrate-binding protein
MTSSFSRKPTLVICLLVALSLTSCGGSGAAEGTVVRVYVVAPLCGGAEAELARRGGEAGGLRVRAVCLPSDESLRKLDLAQIGTNARRATEDASSVAYIGERTGAASRFSAPILESPGIAQLPGRNGAAAMADLLQALNKVGADSDSLRASVNDALE